MPGDSTRYNVPFKAPALPYAPSEYNQQAFEQFNNILRIYFNQLDNALRNAMSSSNSYYMDVAQGLVAGATAVNIFGFNRDVGTAFETIWNDSTTYSFPSTADTLDLVSTSTADTMDVLITGLDSSYDVLTETVTLTGTTPVSTTNTFLRINNAIILSGSNAGDITIEHDGTEVGLIDAGLGTTQQCVYTVPRNKTLYLLRIDLTSGTVNGNQYLTYRNHLRTPEGRVLRVAEATWQDGQQSFDRQVPFRIAEKTDFQFEAKGSNGTNEVSIFVEAILYDN